MKAESFDSSNPPASMRVDYDHLAHRYDDHRHGGGPYLAKLIELASGCSAQTVLELGAGTGNNTQAFIDAYPCRMIASEPSSGMLARGHAKGLDVQWLQASADAIPLADGSAPFIFGVYILHHLADLVRVSKECVRVIDHGCVAFVTASTSFIERHPMNRYFPSFAQIDTARFQSIEVVKDAMLQAGFIETDSELFADVPRPIDRAYVARVAAKFISTYDLLPADEFTEGLARLRADVDAKGRLDTPIVWESAVVWGRV